MRPFSLVLLVALAVPLIAAPVPKNKIKDAEAIQGKWNMVELLQDGKPSDKSYQNATVTLDQESMSVTEQDRMRDEVMAYKLDAEKKWIDLSPKVPGEDIELKGIYELDGDTLKIAVPISGKGERPKEAKSGAGVAFLKLQRVKEEKK